MKAALALYRSEQTRLGAILLAGCGPSKKVEVSKTPLPPTDLRGQTQVEIDARSDQFTPDNIIVTLPARSPQPSQQHPSNALCS